MSSEWRLAWESAAALILLIRGFLENGTWCSFLGGFQWPLSAGPTWSGRINSQGPVWKPVLPVLSSPASPEWQCDPELDRDQPLHLGRAAQQAFIVRAEMGRHGKTEPWMPWHSPLGMRRPKAAVSSPHCGEAQWGATIIPHSTAPGGCGYCSFPPAVDCRAPGQGGCLASLLAGQPPSLLSQCLCLWAIFPSRIKGWGLSPCRQGCSPDPPPRLDWEAYDGM